MNAALTTIPSLSSRHPLSAILVRFCSWIAAAGIATHSLLLPSCAQTDLVIAIQPGPEHGVEISWPVRSLVPPPGDQIIPFFRLSMSSNLVDWTPDVRSVTASTAPPSEVRAILSQTPEPVFVRVEVLLDFSGWDLVGARLAGGQFERATFFGADLFGADLAGAMLNGANLEAADLREALLTRSTLRGAGLLGATLARSDLGSADLGDADIRYADLSGASLVGTDLRGADLRFTSLLGADVDFTSFHGTIRDDHTRMDPTADMFWKIVNGHAAGSTLTNRDLLFCDCRDGNLSSANLAGSDLRGSDLRGADLSGADLQTTVMDFVDFRGSRIDDATRLSDKARLIWELNNQDSQGRELRGRDLSRSFLVRARLSGATLISADLRLSVLFEADFSGAVLRAANLTDADATGTDFGNADLRGAILLRADLTGASLFGANLTNANLTGAIFQNTTMPDGSVRTDP